MSFGDAPTDIAEPPMAFGEPPTSFGEARAFIGGLCHLRCAGRGRTRAPADGAQPGNAASQVEGRGNGPEAGGNRPQPGPREAELTRPASGERHSRPGRLGGRLIRHVLTQKHLTLPGQAPLSFTDNVPQPRSRGGVLMCQALSL